MNDGLKQRIVGALVLLALGIIFIPVIFDKERIEPVDRVSQIPPEPQIERLPLSDAPVAPNPVSSSLSGGANGQFSIEDAERYSEEKNDDAPNEINTVQGENKQAVNEASDSLKTSDANKLKAEHITRIKDKGESSVSAAQPWLLQVASYKYEAHAIELRNELIASGYKAFTKSVNTSSGARTRLYIGPNIRRSSLEKAKIKIDEKYRVTTILLKYTP